MCATVLKSNHEDTKLKTNHIYISKIKTLYASNKHWTTKLTIDM